MSGSSPAEALPPAVATALQELKQRLHDPKIVQLALKQYVVGEIVKTLLTADGTGTGALSIDATSKTDTTDDEGGTSCATESYSVLGIEVYSHTVCGTSTVSDQITVQL